MLVCLQIMCLTSRHYCYIASYKHCIAMNFNTALLRRRDSPMSSATSCARTEFVILYLQGSARSELCMIAVRTLETRSRSGRDSDWSDRNDQSCNLASPRLATRLAGCVVCMHVQAPNAKKSRNDMQGLGVSEHKPRSQASALVLRYMMLLSCSSFVLCSREDAFFGYSEKSEKSSK